MTLVDPYSPRAAAIWRALEARARPSYFLTWAWMENWLAMLPRGEVGSLAVVRDRDGDAGAFFVARRTIVRHGVVPSRAVFVNATGVPRHDEVCIEHNGVLATRATLAQMVALVQGAWDELYLPGVDRDAFADLDVPKGHRVQVLRTAPAPFVDLARVRAAGDYLAVIAANTRAQLRRARRHVGACEVELASSVDHALVIYDDLVALHQASWRARGLPGAFADPWFEQLHRRLIKNRFPHGEIELLRLRHGATTIGCLYNLVANGRSLFYQSGLAHFDDPAIKPGLLCHAAAIERAAAAGLDVYDLLGGDARYKAQLATDHGELAWLCVQRDRLRFALEERARRWKRAIANAYSMRDRASIAQALRGRTA